MDKILIARSELMKKYNSHNKKYIFAIDCSGSTAQFQNVVDMKNQF